MQKPIYELDAEAIRAKLNFVRKVKKDLRGALKIFTIAERRLMGLLRETEARERERKAG